MATGANQRKKYDEYKNSHTREKNKIRRIRHHFQQHPNDVISLSDIIRLEAIIAKR